MSVNFVVEVEERILGEHTSILIKEWYLKYLKNISRDPVIIHIFIQFYSYSSDKIKEEKTLFLSHMLSPKWFLSTLTPEHTHKFVSLLSLLPPHSVS